MAGVVLAFSNHWLKNKSGWKDFLVLNSVGFLSPKRSNIVDCSCVLHCRCIWCKKVRIVRN